MHEKLQLKEPLQEASQRRWEGVGGGESTKMVLSEGISTKASAFWILIPQNLSPQTLGRGENCL